MYMCTNMTFVCLTLWLEEVCTDAYIAAADDTNADANNDARRTKHDCKTLWLINKMSQNLSDFKNAAACEVPDCSLIF